MPFPRYLPAMLPALFFATPVHASVGIPLPEPSGLFLLSMGIVGVVVGRHLSSKNSSE